MKKKSDFNLNLYEYAKKNNILLSIHWELTSSCNLNCIHCYLPKFPSYYEYHSAIKLIDYIEELNILYVGITGGEVLLHPNFLDIYRMLKKRGFLVTVFTNGLLINNEIIKLFKDYPPFELKISIYGSSDSCFARVTRRPWFYKFENALDLLNKNEVKYSLQTPIMTANYSDIDAIEEYCKSRNVSYKFGTMICPMVNGCHSNLNQRIDADDIVDYEAKINGAINKWVFDYKSTNPKGEVLRCAAGKNYFVLDSEGNISMCGLLRQPAFKFTDKESFDLAMVKIQEIRKQMEDVFWNGPCSHCHLVKLCLGCPAYSKLENDDYQNCILYLRKIAERKYDILTENCSIEKKPISIS